MKSIKIFYNIGLSIFFLLALFIFEPSLSNLYHKFRGGAWDAGNNSSLLGEIRGLRLENESLKNKLSIDSAQRGHSYKIGNVYSEYPFNDRRILVIDLGLNDGIVAGMPVLFDEYNIIGTIDSISGNKSTVQTIFDPDWQSSVAIGDAKIKAVLRGGNSPRLDLIPKDAVLVSGATVSNISERFPINLLFGEIIEASSGENDVWQTAKLKIFYDLDALHQVRVITDFL